MRGKIAEKKAKLTPGRKICLRKSVYKDHKKGGGNHAIREKFRRSQRKKRAGEEERRTRKEKVKMSDEWNGKNRRIQRMIARRQLARVGEKKRKKEKRGGLGEDNEGMTETRAEGAENRRLFWSA